MNYALRPACMDDAQGVVDLCNADEARFLEKAEHDVERRRIVWQRSRFDFETDTRIAQRQDRSLAGYAVVQDRDEHLAVAGEYWVDPACADPAVESALLGWMETRARDALARAPQGSRVTLNQKVLSLDGHRATLLGSRGYHVVRHFTRMRIDMTRCPPVETLPAGIAIRSLRPDQDLPALSLTTNESFRGHWGHVARAREDDIARYKQWLDDDPQLDPSLWHLAFEADDVVGACLGTAHWPGEELLAYIFTLGVRPPWRGLGIGKGLLHHAFRCFYLAGRPSVELDVDAANMTGALRLYEGVGMKPTWQKDFYELELRRAVLPTGS